MMSVAGLTEIPVEGCSQALELLHMGGSRQTASTLMNSESSDRMQYFKSLSLVAVSWYPMRRMVRIDMYSNIKSVSCGPCRSERLKRTGAEGLRQREGISINYGLSVLGNVIKLCVVQIQLQVWELVVNLAHLALIKIVQTIFRTVLLTRLRKVTWR